jgi:hypothetical protein
MVRLRATSVFLGRKLRQQVRPVAGNNAADFGVDLRDVVEAFLNLLAEHLKFFSAERPAVQKFDWHVLAPPGSWRRRM